MDVMSKKEVCGNCQFYIPKEGGWPYPLSGQCSENKRVLKFPHLNCDLFDKDGKPKFKTLNQSPNISRHQ